MTKKEEILNILSFLKTLIIISLIFAFSGFLILDVIVAAFRISRVEIIVVVLGLVDIIFCVLSICLLDIYSKKLKLLRDL